MSDITVHLENGDEIRCPEGTRVCSLLKSPTDDSGLSYIAAVVNNDVSSLSYPLTVNCSVRFLTLRDPHGWRVYRRSLGFLLAKTLRDLYPQAHFSIEHSFGTGIYCSFKMPDRSNGMNVDEMEHISKRMRELVERDLPIERHKIAFTDAVRQFEESAQPDKLGLLKYRNPPRIVVHWCDGFSDLAHGPLVPSTGTLSQFDIIHYSPGFVLQFPDRTDPKRIPPFEDQPHLFHIFQEHKQWGRILGVNTVGRLNDTIAAGEMETFIRTAEALHEKKLSRIADRIAEARSHLKFILIAGPSSAGKTTFAKRLTTHLTVEGLQPVTISTDNYFVGADRNPLDEDGKPDFEHIEAVDLELFNEHLVRLIDGEEVEIPFFNFETKQREYRGRKLRVDADQVVIIEGIHGLNPRLTSQVPPDRTFKIYVSALTQLNVDANNRISTTDNRLMRRMVRDHRYRGHSALDTLQLWPSVRRGEKRWVFPFQREANATFNSALDYELAVLKPRVEPLLMQIKPSHTEYAEARRLTEFLLNFLAAPDRGIPRTSILREYIGGSDFRY